MKNKTTIMNSGIFNSIKKKSFLLLFLFVFAGFLNAKAQCALTTTITNGISGTNSLTVTEFITWLNANEISCNGEVTISDGVDIIVDVSATIPSHIDLIIIEDSDFVSNTNDGPIDGGQIIYPNNSVILTLAQSTAIIIENTLVDDSNSLSAISTDGQACNNTKRLNIGLISYSACTGGGNVCLIFAELVAVGGTPLISPVVAVIAGGDGNDVCFPEAEIEIVIENLPAGIFPTDNTAESKPAYEWNKLIGPGNATYSIGVPDTSVPNQVTLTTTVTVDADGSYFFELIIQIPLGAPGSKCDEDFAELRTPPIDIDFVISPTALFTAIPSGTTCGLTVNFDASTSIDANDNNNKNLTYSWDFGDGGSSTLESPSHTFASETDYDVILTVTDPDSPFAACESDSLTQTLTVTSCCDDLDAGDDNNSTAFCFGGGAAINLTDLLNNEDPGGEWAQTGGTSVIDFSIPGLVNFSSAIADDYVFTYTHSALISNACLTSVATITVAIDAQPVAAAGADQTLCATADFTMAAVATVGTGMWTTTNTDVTITSPTSATTTVTGLLPDTTATLTWTETNGTCSDSDDVVIQNDAQPVVSDESNQTECDTTDFLMTQSDPSVGTGIWTLESGTVTITASGSPTTTVTGLVAGTTATLRWTVTNGTCSDSDTVVLTNNPLPEAPTASDQSVCSDGSESQTLTAIASGGSITWFTTATGGNPIQGGPTQVGLGTSTYYAEAINENGCVSATRTQVVLTINSRPHTPAAFDQTVCSNGDPLQTLTATGIGSNIRWYNAETGGTLVQNPIQIGVGSSTYYAESTANECISLSRAMVVLTINDAPDAPISGGDQSVCSDGTDDQTLTATATGGTITWYDAAEDGDVVNPTQVGIGTTTYYAESSDDMCSSLTRTAVVVTIRENPVIEFTQVDVLCSGTSTGSIDATVSGGTVAVDYTYSWVGPNGFTASTVDISALEVGAYTLTITDDYGCEATESATISGPPAEDALSITCSDAVNLDSCSDEQTISDAYDAWILGFGYSNGSNPSEDSTAPALPDYLCGGEVSLTYNYSVTDDCGTETCSSTFNVAATIPLSFSATPEDITVACAAQVPGDQDITVVDGCAIGSTLIFTQSTFPECNGDVINTWTITDDCGNVTMYSQTVTILDEIAPEFTSDLPGDLTAECSQIPQAATITATDSCGGDITVEPSEVITREDGDCAGMYTITRVWLVSDCGDNSITHTQVITVVDNTAPVLIDFPDAEITVVCSDIPEAATVTATDNCSSESEITEVYEEDTSVPDADGNYTITRVWVLSDQCGNGSSFIQTINVEALAVVGTTADICIEDSDIDLFSLISGSSDEDGTWEDDNSSGGLSGNMFDPESVAIGSYNFTYTSSTGTCNFNVTVTVNVNDDCVVLPCSTEDLYISRAVTPNGDGQNDTFEVGGLDLCDFTFDVKIFNRWGHMVFESSDYQNNWDGYNYGGGMTIGSATELPSGTYYYVLNIMDSGFKPMTGYIYLGTN